MSKFNAYSGDNIADRYDSIRNLVGYEAIKPYLSNEEEQVIVDLACGTGCLLEKIDNNFSKVDLIGVDNNLEMLISSNKKLNPDFNGIVNESLLVTKNGNTGALILKELGSEDPNPTPIPFTADIIVSTQLLHHIGGELGGVKLLTEASKCSKIGSTLFINWTPPEQIVSFWYLQLIPRLIDVFNKKTIPICRLAYIAKAFGWEVKDIVVHNGEEETLQKYENYLDYNGPLQEDYLIGHETWSLATDDEITACQEQIKKMSPVEGKEMLANLDIHRRAFGQTTTLILEKVKNVDKIENLLIQNME